MLKETDNEIYNLIQEEKDRQDYELNMIPSENYCSKEVLEASGSVLNNKYAEGYPKKRYYQGNRVVDEVETIAIERAKKLFGAEYANVQPLSGSGANMAAYFALLEHGDKIMGMELSQGGHLTHGSPVNFSGKLYNFVSYGVDEKTGLLDMEKVRELAIKEKPKMIVAGYTAYPRTVDFKKFSEIAQEVGAYLMADVSHIAGLIVGGVHNSPVPYADIVTTTTHKTLRGPRSALILCKEKYGKAVDKAVFPGLQGGPHEHIIAAKAVAFKEAMSNDFKKYAEQTIKNAQTLAKTLMDSGVKLVSDGTDNHLLLIDLIKTEFVGKIGVGKEYAVALEDAGIITNANTVPYDPSTPFKPSGIRLGTPTLTTRGFKEEEMIKVGNWMIEVLKNPEDSEMKERIRNEVKELCKKFNPNF
ncbi:serine hydroxymethyltransferase [Candidatus Woesearchaeota archaeon]|nr:serine hydroxymethyltransferase [Candidatus Woesearchaeota archaeon]